VHFPKAGGSSLKVQLIDMLGENLLLDYEHHPLGQHAMEEVYELPPQYTMVHGHFRASRYTKLRERFLFTFLRNPVDNLVSIYFFWRDFPDTGNYWHSKFLREKPSILEFARYGPFQRHMSEAYFGGFDMNHVDFIGFHETRMDDYRKLESLINLPLRGDLHANKTENGREERAAMMQSKETMGALADLLADDLRFYDQLYVKRKT
jgi:hypothetical protein